MVTVYLPVFFLTFCIKYEKVPEFHSAWNHAILQAVHGITSRLIADFRCWLEVRYFSSRPSVCSYPAVQTRSQFLLFAFRKGGVYGA